MDAACARAGVARQDIRRVIHFNDNGRQLADLAKDLDIALDQTNAEIALEHGHIGCADQLVTLSRLLAAGELAAGDLVALTSTSSGMHWICTLLRGLRNGDDMDTDNDVWARVRAVRDPACPANPSLLAVLAALTAPRRCGPGRMLAGIPLARITGEGKPLRPLRVAIAATFTAENVAPVLRVELRNGIAPDMRVSGFDQLLVKLSDTQLDLAGFAPDVTLCLLHDEALYHRTGTPADLATLTRVGQPPAGHAGAGGRRLRRAVRQRRRAAHGAARAVPAAARDQLRRPGRDSAAPGGR